MKKIKELLQVFKVLLKCDEYIIITSKKYGDKEDDPVYYEYHNNTNRKIFYIFALDHIKKLYRKAKD